MLLKARSYLKIKQKVSVQQLANYLRCQRSAIEPMLNVLVQRGECRVITKPTHNSVTVGQPQNQQNKNQETTTPENSNKIGCKGACISSCSSHLSSSAATLKLRPQTYYQWVSN